MSFTQHLPDETIDEIAGAAQELGLLGTQARNVLLQDIAPGFRFAIPDAGNPIAQLLVDLSKLNKTERLLDGTVPLEQWLRQAIKLGGLDQRTTVFQRALDDLAVRTSGEPAWTPPEDLPEYQEAIVHQDDKIPFGFLEQGRKVGASVARIQVDRYENGQPLVRDGIPVTYNGTGWLIGPKLLITNHHVINARDQGEAPATPDDLQLQAASASAQFGFDAKGLQGASVAAASLSASDKQLDFAILELEADPGIAPLRLAAKPVVLKAGEYPPLNIIQHPLGGPKMIAIRNNLATGSTDTDLRYFTDTDYGSSGSPVFDDTWAVVALHRAASAARQPVNFQGRSTAVVNVGTRISSIRDYLEVHHPDLRQRISP
jgi:endonuclease G